ncbi:MAG: hypothetical protein AABY15_03640 [Nanoarchaeota archaeon]|mgnify:CR=1 FL=1
MIKNKKKGLALSQIVILIFGIIAISYSLGSSLGQVSAQDEEDEQSLNDEGFGPIPGSASAAEPNPTFPKILEDIGIYFGIDKITKDSAAAGKAAYDKVIAGGGTVEAAKKAGKAAAEDAMPGFFAKFFGKPESVWGVLQNALIAASVVAAITFLYVGVTTGNWEKAGYAAARTATGAAVGYGVAAAVAALGGPAGWVSAAIISLFVYLSQYLERETDRQVSFICKPWQAPKGGADCLSCNQGKFPCTEYQCKSLGTGCDLINKNSSEPRCIWKDQNDLNPPKITAWAAALKKGYRYDPLPQGQYGVEIKYESQKCLPAFQEFTFGVELDKNGYCRLEFQSTKNFSLMKNDFGGENLYIKQHMQLMSFPGKRYLEEELKRLKLPYNITYGNFEVYVRCESASNNIANREEFLFKFCVDPKNETTAPIIRGFNWEDGKAIAHFNETEAHEVGVQAYVNKPAQCRWDHEDKEYKNMENNLTCANQQANLNSQLSYTCSGKLTGLENNKANKFYFRCNDTLGNFNKESKPLTLIGTQQLYIKSVEPDNTTIKGASNSINVTLKAETSVGYEEGKAKCYYSITGASGSYAKFTNTNSHMHSTERWLNSGNHSYFIRCFDSAGNADTKKITFSLETDTQAPAVVRAYHDGSNLKIITNEPAECVYDIKECLYDFKDGISMTPSDDDKWHTTTWDPLLTFFIKCKDEYGNQPGPSECSIKVRPFNL